LRHFRGARSAYGSREKKLPARRSEGEFSRRKKKKLGTITRRHPSRVEKKQGEIRGRGVKEPETCPNQEMWQSGRKGKNPPQARVKTKKSENSLKGGTPKGEWYDQSGKKGKTESAA